MSVVSRKTTSSAHRLALEAPVDVPLVSYYITREFDDGKHGLVRMDMVYEHDGDKIVETWREVRLGVA